MSSWEVEQHAIDECFIGKEIDGWLIEGRLDIPVRLCPLYVCSPTSPVEDGPDKFICKYLNPEEGEDKILHEFDAVGDLSTCPRIVRHFHRSEAYVRRGFLVFMEYYAQGDLFEYLAARAFLSDFNDDYKQELIRSISKHVLLALSHMHATGYVHRDVKPENIFLADNGSDIPDAYLGDLGFAVRLDDADPNEILSSGPYMAPELICEEDWNEKVDMWSLGVTMYLMFTGEWPFGHWRAEDRDSQQIYYLGACNVDCDFSVLPENVRDLICGLLQRDPEIRLSAEDALRHDFFQGKAPDFE